MISPSFLLGIEGPESEVVDLEVLFLVASDVDLAGVE
jgi:hypothetical protein